MDSLDIKLIGVDIPYRIAMKDISNYLKENYFVRDEYQDVWFVTPYYMMNKESRKLNKKLGLHKINKYGQKMNKFNNNKKK
jgi:hypothetical protein